MYVQVLITVLSTKVLENLFSDSVDVIRGQRDAVNIGAFF
jgi:hypothetical protein